MFFISAESSLVTTANFWKAAPMSSSSSSLVMAVSPSLSSALENSISKPQWSEVINDVRQTVSHLVFTIYPMYSSLIWKYLLIPDCWISLTDFFSFIKDSLSWDSAWKRKYDWEQRTIEFKHKSCHWHQHWADKTLHSGHLIMFGRSVMLSWALILMSDVISFDQKWKVLRGINIPRCP